MNDTYLASQSINNDIIADNLYSDVMYANNWSEIDTIRVHDHEKAEFINSVNYQVRAYYNKFIMVS